MTFRTLFAFAFVFGATFATLGCDTAAVVQLRLDNETGKGGKSETQQALSTSNASTSPATRLAIRLSQVYLAEDIDEKQRSVGRTSVVWRATRCANGCPLVDLAKDSDELSDEMPVPGALTHAGTYRFVRLEVCNTGAETNVEWSDGVIGTRQATHGWCAISSAPIDPPVTLEVGEVAKITLAYDLSASVATGPMATFDATADKVHPFIDCSNDATTGMRTCLRLPTLRATISKK